MQPADGGGALRTSVVVRLKDSSYVVEATVNL